MEEITLAQQHASNASEVERALIDALSKRYAHPQPEDRTPLDQAKEQGILRERIQQIPKETAVSNNTAESVVALANHMIEGELLIAEGKFDPGSTNCVPRSHWRTL